VVDPSFEAKKSSINMLMLRQLKSALSAGASLRFLALPCAKLCAAKGWAGVDHENRETLRSF